MITKKLTSNISVLFFILALLLGSCGTAASPTPDLQATGTALGLQETMVALNDTPAPGQRTGSTTRMI